ncbi:hypothetical protein C2G38_2035725 [Gigaspora rosea]|uniref:Uncharacterized protein n=1 Tax=Gigaspora rosea TaxID=44941 RepID=A0A397VBI9_9GLOM|nr:hypothetical protein C2G38_2035725 [Gigaspora rosea]
MSSSEPEELIVEDHTPHGGKNISEYVCSPNIQYIVTWSKDDDKSIVGWTITDDPSNDLSIEPINSLNTNDLKSLLKFDDFKYFSLKRASDCKQFIILYFGRPNEFAVINITTKSRQILNAQGLKDNKLDFDMDDIAFLENGDIAIAKGEPVYRAYIFSKLKFNDKYQWICKNSIELEKNFKCKIYKNGTLLMHFLTPNVITQWNLITQKFEMQYILNLNLFAKKSENQFEMNSDNKLLAIAFHTENKSIAVYVYSTKSETFSYVDSEFLEIHELCFIGSKEKERLLISFRYGDTKMCIFSILNTLIYTLDEKPDTNVLHDILSHNHNDYIIKIDENDLLIKKLSQNENWKNHLQGKGRYVGSGTFFNIKEIKQFIQDTLDRYKSNQFLTQSYSDASKEYPGEAYTWIVKTRYFFMLYKIYLIAQIKSNLKETESYFFHSYDSADGYILEIKVLKNDDIILVSSSGIRIFSVNSEKSSIELIYFWKEDIQEILMLEKSLQEISTQEAQQFIIKHLFSFKNKLDLDIDFLPTPIFDIHNNCFDTLKNNELGLKLYGKEIIHKVVQWNKSILVLAFAHSLHILLRPTTEYSYNQPSYTKDINNPWNLVSTYQFISSNGTVDGSSLVEIPNDNTNMFAQFSTSLLAVYFMLTDDEEIFQNLLPAVKEIVEIKNTNEEIKDTIKVHTDKSLKDSTNAKIDESLKDVLKAQIDESLKDKLKIQIDESLKDVLKTQINELLKDTLKIQIDELLKDKLKIQIDEALKDPIDKVNRLVEFIEKKESE